MAQQPTPAALQQCVLTAAGLHTCCLQAPTTHPTHPSSHSCRSSRSQAAGAAEQHASQHSQHPRRHPLLLQQLQQALALWRRCARLCRLVCHLLSVAARNQAAVAAARTDTCVPCVCVCCRAILQNGEKQVSQPVRSMCPGLWMSSKLQVGAGALGRVGRHFGMLQAHCGSCCCCLHCSALCVLPFVCLQLLWLRTSAASCSVPVLPSATTKARQQHRRQMGLLLTRHQQLAASVPASQQGEGARRRSRGLVQQCPWIC